MSSGEPAGESLLLAELRHRFGNFVQLLLGLVQMRQRAAQSDETRDSLKAISDTIQTLFSLQQKLMQADGDMAFPAHLRETVESWKAIGAAQNVQLTVQADDAVALPPEAATTLALIVHELVTNCFEHGFPSGRAGKIHIALGSLREGQAHLTITDDGCGLEPDGPSGTSLGLTLVRSLTDRLGGTFTLTPNEAGGAIASVRFPQAARP